MTSSTEMNTPTPTPPPSSPIQPPAPDPGYSNVVISESSTQIEWSSGWVVQFATCNSTQHSRVTVTADEWLTLITSPYSSPYVYLDVAVFSVSFTVYINGVQSDTNLGAVSNNCTYNSLGPLLTGSTTNNITIYINGPSLSSRDLQSSGSSWSFEFNQFIVGQQLDATSSASSTAIPTSHGFNAATKDEPQTVILWSLASLQLLAALFWA